MQQPVFTLAHFIEQHGHKASVEGDTLRVVSVWCRDGIGYDVEEVIPATCAAVYAWLGY